MTKEYIRCSYKWPLFSEHFLFFRTVASRAAEEKYGAQKELSGSTTLEL